MVILFSFSSLSDEAQHLKKKNWSKKVSRHMNSRLGEPRECPSYFDIVCNEVGNPAHVRAQVDTKHQGNSFASCRLFFCATSNCLHFEKKEIRQQPSLFIYLFIFYSALCWTLYGVVRAGYLSTCNFLVVGFDVVVVVPAKSVDSLSMVECDRNSDASLEK